MKLFRFYHTSPGNAYRFHEVVLRFRESRENFVIFYSGPRRHMTFFLFRGYK